MGTLCRHSRNGERMYQNDPIHLCLFQLPSPEWLFRLLGNTLAKFICYILVNCISTFFIIHFCTITVPFIQRTATVVGWYFAVEMALQDVCYWRWRQVSLTYTSLMLPSLSPTSSDLFLGRWHVVTFLRRCISATERDPLINLYSWKCRFSCLCSNSHKDPGCMGNHTASASYLVHIRAIRASRKWKILLTGTFFRVKKCLK